MEQIANRVEPPDRGRHIVAQILLLVPLSADHFLKFPFGICPALIPDANLRRPAIVEIPRPRERHGWRFGPLGLFTAPSRCCDEIRHQTNPIISTLAC